MTHNKYYEKRSNLRQNLLGCGNKTYMEPAKKCFKRTRIRARKPNEIQKQAFLGMKSSQSGLFMCAISNEITSDKNLINNPALLEDAQTVCWGGACEG